MHESVKMTLTGEVCPKAGTGSRRTRWLGSLVAALALWGCGGEGQAPESAPVSEAGPVATATTESALTCTPAELESSGWTCAGAFTYSLECYVRQAGTACGTDTSPKTCTTYQTCQHPDFGRTRGTYLYGAPPGKLGLGCDAPALSHLNTLSAEDRAGVTYTYIIGLPPPPPGEESLVGGGAAKTAAAPTSGIDTEWCYITYSNYPITATGTGPQCGTSQTTCSPACVNPQTCLVDGAWVTGSQCGTMVGPCSATSLSPLYDTCRDASHGTAPDAECGAGFENAQAPAGSTPAQVQALAASQWTAAGNSGAPVYDAPITCSDCRGPIHLTSQELRRRVYSAAAMAKRDAKVHILAGSAYYLSRDNPTLSQQDLTAALSSISTALAAYDLPAAQDGSGPMMRRTLRILISAETFMGGTTPASRALRAFTRDLLASMRLGLPQERRLASLLQQVDRYPDAESFISDTWTRLFDETVARPALAAVVNDGTLGTALTVRTTDSVQHILTVYPLEPLKTFVLTNLSPDGSLNTTPEKLRTLVGDAGQKGIDVSRAYVDNLTELNKVEQAWRKTRTLPDPTAQPTTTPPVTDDALKAAIEKAKTRNEQLAANLKDHRESLTGAFDMAAELAKKSNDPDFAKDIKVFGQAVGIVYDAVQKYAESSVETAKKIVGMLELGAKGLELVSAALFTGQMVGAIFKIISLFSAGPAQPTPEEIIIAKVTAIKELVEDVRDEMRGRFDRTDRNINNVYAEMTRQFELVHWELGTIDGNVNALQKSLFIQQGDLNRMERNIFTFLDALSRREFTEMANGSLGWRERVLDPTQVMDFTQEYLPAENKFYTWGGFFALDPLASGADTRSHEDDALYGEFTTFPLAFNVNYLRTLPTKFGMSPLANDRIANPMEWTVGAEAYVQLAEEWPQYASNVSSDRRDKLVTEGSRLRMALANIENPVLFNALAANYDARWEELKAAINVVEQQFEANPANRLHGADLWSGPDQRPPARNFLMVDPPQPGHALRRCDGGGTYEPGVDALVLHLGRWPHDELKPFLMAHNLGLGVLDACIEGHWSWVDPQLTPWGTNWTFKLYSQVFIRWNGAKIYVHRFNSEETRSKLIRTNDPAFDPDTYYATYLEVSQNWGAMVAQDSIRQFTATAPQLAAVRAAVNAELVNVHKAFYAKVASEFPLAGTPVSMTAQRLSGARLLWESYVAMGLPLSVEHDDVLREQLYGPDGVMTGRDIKADDVLLNDVEDAYRYFSTTPPGPNALLTLDTTVKSRSARLKTTVTSILSRLAATGDSESSAWVDASLLRLRVATP